MIIIKKALLPLAVFSYILMIILSLQKPLDVGATIILMLMGTMFTIGWIVSITPKVPK